MSDIDDTNFARRLPFIVRYYWDNRGATNFSQLIPPEVYVAREPMVYLLLLRDYIRPCTEICNPCKVKCCETFIRGASGRKFYWNTNVQQLHWLKDEELLDAKLAKLGYTKDNGYGVFKDEAEIWVDKSYEMLTLTLSVWLNLTRGVTICTKYGTDRKTYHPVLVSALVRRLRFMIKGGYTIHNLAQDGGQALQQFLMDTNFNLDCHYMPRDCTCRLYRDALGGKNANEFTALEWVDIVLNTARKQIDGQIIGSWDVLNNNRPAIWHEQNLRPLCSGYTVEESWHEWTFRARWTNEPFDEVLLDEPSGIAEARARAERRQARAGSEPSEESEESEENEESEESEENEESESSESEDEGPIRRGVEVREKAMYHVIKYELCSMWDPKHAHFKPLHDVEEEVSSKKKDDIEADNKLYTPYTASVPYFKEAGSWCLYRWDDEPIHSEETPHENPRLYCISVPFFTNP
ncbi:hypothetical protein B0T24DRAFT_696937 [Lasiosphaeria ovina]|uniref:Uncharacterized protein n=1 Tax=Lasiosphaeria ovina TaxID=92902 RepID=A0AAE0NFD1_9PEZI|nr:hypothetical protein B0T24DRAFT_696937 [Lasiosphaeria ovina]